MPIVNWLIKRIRKVRKRYIVDVPPELVDTFKQYGQDMFELGMEFSSKTISDTASKTLTDLAKDKVDY